MCFFVVELWLQPMFAEVPAKSIVNFNSIQRCVKSVVYAKLAITEYRPNEMC